MHSLPALPVLTVSLFWGLQGLGRLTSAPGIRILGARSMLRLYALGAALCLSRLVEIPERSALRGYDNTFNYLWLRSAMVDHDWDFRNDL